MEEIRVSQINLQHSQDATAELSRILTGTGDGIILIQEPYCYRNEVRGIAATHNIIVGHTGRDNPPRTAIVASKDLDVVPLPHLGTRDVTAAVLEYRVSHNNRFRLVIASVYLPYDIANLPPTQDLERLVSFARDKGLPILIGCDANAHNTIWGSTDTNTRGSALLEFLVTVNLEVINKGREPTFVNRVRKEVIDITLTTPDFVEKVKDWRVSSEINTSDHRMITYKLDHKPAEQKPSRNPRSTNWDLYRSKLKDLMENHQEGPILSEEELESENESLTGKIQKAYEESCPPRKKPERRVPWWNNNLTTLRKEVRKAFRRAVQEGNEDGWNAYLDKRREFKREVRLSKIASWRSYCSDLESLSETARLTKLLSGATREIIGSLKKGDGSWTASGEESLRHLLEVHFPGSAEPQIQIPGLSEIEPDHELAKEIVTEGATAWAINEFEPYKAAGPDGVFPALLQKGAEIVNKHLGRMFTASVTLGYVPKAWRAARVVFIPKPGKEDYCAAKSYRPISLTSFLMKTLEKMIDRYLMEVALKQHPIHKDQHAYSKGRSTDTALHAVVSRIEKALHFGEVALGLFFDVEGAFDKARVSTICGTLLARGIKPALAKWVKCALEDRAVETTLGDCRQGAAVRGGCPQGSCLSPHLWCLVMDGLLEKLNQEGFYSQAYADDGLVLIRGRFVGMVCERMQSACRIIERWCRENGLTVNPSKTELILFTKRRKLGSYRLPVMYNEPLILRQEVKYLGVILDSKLNWKKQVQKVTQRAVATFWQLRRVVARTWGLRPKVLFWLYTAVVRPRILYGSIVWWPSLEKSYVRTQLAKVQRLACLGITGAMRTTPTAALNVILSLPSLHTHVRREAMAAYLRMRDGGAWQTQGTVVGHATIERMAEREIPIANLRVPQPDNRLRLERKYSLRIPTREQWLEGELELPEPSRVWYTDGSKMARTGSSGAGVCRGDQGVGRSFSFGTYATVF